MSLTSVRVSWQGLLKQPECADNIVVRTFRSVATTHNASTFLNNFDTWWSRETVTLNFSRMEVKSTNNGLPLWNLGRFWYFDVAKGPGEKTPAFQGCAKIVCFPSWHGSGVSGSVCLSLLVSVYAWCSLYDMRGHLGISGSVFRDKSICFGDQM